MTMRKRDMLAFRQQTADVGLLRTPMDQLACLSCRKNDGLVGSIELLLPKAPNPECTNPNGCRCRIERPDHER